MPDLASNVLDHGDNLDTMSQSGGDAEGRARMSTIRRAYLMLALHPIQCSSPSRIDEIRRLTSQPPGMPSAPARVSGDSVS